MRPVFFLMEDFLECHLANVNKKFFVYDFPFVLNKTKKKESYKLPFGFVSQVKITYNRRMFSFLRHDYRLHFL